MTLRALREQGRICAITEKWNPYGGVIVKGKRTGIRQDLLGFIDCLCLDPIKGFVAIQCTGPSGLSERKKKILENPNALEWLKTGIPHVLHQFTDGRLCNCDACVILSKYRKSAIEIWSWRKLLKKRGGTLRTWQPRILEITLVDYEPII